MAKINSELIGNAGNLVNRALGFTKKTFGGVIPKPENVNDIDKKAWKICRICRTNRCPFNAKPSR